MAEATDRVALSKKPVMFNRNALTIRSFLVSELKQNQQLYHTSILTSGANCYLFRYLILLV